MSDLPTITILPKGERGWFGYFTWTDQHGLRGKVE